MGRKSTKWTAKKLAEYVAMGRGMGTGENYRPWLNARDFSTRGTLTRMNSPKLNRTLTFFSNIERNIFLFAEHRSDLADYWEQWPIPLVDSIRIAEEHGVRHPFDNKTKQHIVMTLDGVMSIVGANGEIFRSVFDCKPASLLAHPRTVEKMLIHWAFAREQGWEYHVITEESVTNRELKNLQWMRSGRLRSNEQLSHSVDLEHHGIRLLESLAEASKTPRLLNTAIADWCNDFDCQLGVPSGSSVRALKVLLGSHLLTFPLDDLLIPRQPVRNARAVAKAATSLVSA